MGILYPNAKMLWKARLRGVSFRHALTIGRQSLFLHPPEVRALRTDYQENAPSPLAMPLAKYEFGEYSDRFCQEFLGVATLDAMDYSAYEGATITHDLNKPIPKDLAGRFDAVIESGTLEHIFNFPVAIGNLMRLVKTGGTIFLITPANNLCGHGFYQFSPELMYRIFSAENGFEMKSLAFLEATFPGVELTPIRGTYEVADPVDVKARVGLLSNFPALMMIETTKIRDVPLFANTPLQSDYVSTWKGQTKSAGIKQSLRQLAKKLPQFMRFRLNGYYLNRRYSFRNKQFYKKLS